MQRSWTLVRAFSFKAALHLLAFGVFPIAFPRLFLHLFFNFLQVIFKLLQLASFFISEGSQSSHLLRLWRRTGSNKRLPSRREIKLITIFNIDGIIFKYQKMKIQWLYLISTFAAQVAKLLAVVGYKIFWAIRVHFITPISPIFTQCIQLWKWI